MPFLFFLASLPLLRRLHTREPYVLKQLIARRALGVVSIGPTVQYVYLVFAEEVDIGFVPINGSDGDRVRTQVRELFGDLRGIASKQFRVLPPNALIAGSISGSENVVKVLANYESYGP